MPTAPLRKNKIVLSDYNYRRDIENRLFMAELSVFEVDVLQEILHSSIKISVKSLAEILEIDRDSIIPVVDKFSKTGLLMRREDTITVDKEMRKYYEFQVMKFDDHFEPDMEFLQGLLSKVPIHVLPTWYSISRTSDNIFNSIIEKYLLTPKIYERYLQELNFEDPVLTGIMQDVFQAPEFKIRSRTLREKYSLTRERFEEYMLLLEFNFVCCLSYNRVDELWKEVVTPFHEWKEYLSFLRDTSPQKILNENEISQSRASDFSFLIDIENTLKQAMTSPLPIQSIHSEWTLSPSTISNFNPNFQAPPSYSPQEYFRSILSKILILKLGNIQEEHLHVFPDKASEWLSKTYADRAMFLYRHPLNRLRKPLCDLKIATDKNIREAEKSLRRILKLGWIYFDDFMKGMTSPIGNAEAVILKNKGKRWKYQLPYYTQDEKFLIEATILNRLFELGMVKVGLHQERVCFCVTSFGQTSLGD